MIDSTNMLPKSSSGTGYMAAVEHRAVEGMLQHGLFHKAIDAGLSPTEHFTDSTLAAFCQGCINQFKESGEVDKMEIALQLKDAGLLDEGALSRVIELDDIADHSSTGTHVPALIDRIINAATQRKASDLMHRAQLYQNDSQPLKAAQLAHEAADLLRNATPHSRWKELQARKFDPDKPVEKTVPVLMARGCPIAARGNLTLLSGGDKSGKSHVMASMIRAIEEGGEHLGIESTERGKALYVDIEQSSEDFDELLRTQAHGAATKPDAFCLTGVSPNQALKDLRLMLEHTSGLSAVLIDGFADLIEDVNDAEQSCALVAELMDMAERYAVAFIGVLHLNPGSESKTRGHLGSQLERKSQTVLAIKVQNEERILYTRKARKRPLPESEGIRFAWSDNSKGFEEIEGTPSEIKQAVQADAWTRTLRDIQAKTEMLAWTYSQLTKEIAEVEGVTTRTAKTRIRQFLEVKILRHNASRGNYTSTLPSEMHPNHHELSKQAI